MNTWKQTVKSALFGHGHMTIVRNKNDTFSLKNELALDRRLPQVLVTSGGEPSSDRNPPGSSRARRWNAFPNGSASPLPPSPTLGSSQFCSSPPPPFLLAGSQTAIFAICCSNLEMRSSWRRIVSFRDFSSCKISSNLASFC